MKTKTMNKSILFNFKFSKEEVESIIRQHIIDTHDNEDADFKAVDTFESEDFFWDNSDDKDFVTVDLLASEIPLRKPKAK